MGATVATVPVNKISQNRNPMYGDQNGYMFNWATNSTISTGPSNSGFRAKFYTCDGCRWEYVSDAGSDDTYQIGGIYGRQNYSETYLQTHNAARCTSNLAQVGGRPHADLAYSTNEGLPRQNSAEDPTGSRGDECGTPTYREQLAQAIRPTEDITLTKMKTKMRAAYASSSGLGGVHGSDHNQRTENGDFQSANGATVSVWITKYGKMGENVCRSFTGTTRVGDEVLQGNPMDGTESGYLNNYDNGTLLPGHQSDNFNQEDEILGCGIDNKNCMTCDINNDGVYSELCFTGARCNSSRTDIFGGCGVGGVCDMAEVVENAHYLRNQPAGAGPTTSRCGNDVDCHKSQRWHTLSNLNRLHQPLIGRMLSGSLRSQWCLTSTPPTMSTWQSMKPSPTLTQSSGMEALKHQKIKQPSSLATSSLEHTSVSMWSWMA